MGGLLLPPPATPPEPAPVPSRCLRLPAALPGRAAAWTAPVLAAGLLLLSRPMRRLDRLSAFQHMSLTEAARALAWAPTSWHAWYYLGYHACNHPHPEAPVFAEACMTRAVEMDPNNYRLWRAVGTMRLELGDKEGARAAFARVKALRFWADVPRIPED
jgi:hypothetical protein